MSNIDPTVSNAEVIPHIVTDVFKDNPTARFATGLIAYGEMPRDDMHTVFQAYGKLRYDVYSRQTGMLGEEVRREDGTERDEDDDRSAHFCVIENLGDTQRVVASMRVIRGGDFGKLPIEEFFPEISLHPEEDRNSIEISRYICRHEDPEVQKQLKWHLYSAVLCYIMKNNLGPTLAVVEEPLEKALASVGVPLVRIAEPKLVPEYNDYNLGIEIDTNGLFQKMESDNPGSVSGFDLNQLVFSGSRDAVTESV